MQRKEDLVCYDFQGWPEFKMNLREILVALGGACENGKICFDENDPFMDVYPGILMDDGMGYGVDENVIVEIDYDREREDIKIFRERIPTEEQRKELDSKWDGE